MKKQCFTKATAFILILSMMMPLYTFADSAISIYLNGDLLLSRDGKAVTPLLKDNITYLPLRAISEAMQISINWDSKTASILIGNGQPAKVKKTSGMSIYLNGNLFTPKDAQGKALNPLMKDGTTYLPLRAISEALKVPLKWESDTQRILLGTTNSKDVVALQVGDQTVSYSLYKEYLSIFKNIALLQYGEEAFFETIDGQDLNDVIKESLIERLVTQKLIEKFMIKQGFKLDETKLREGVAQLKFEVSSDQTMRKLYAKSKVTHQFYEDSVKSTMINVAFTGWLMKEILENPSYQLAIDKGFNTDVFVKARHILFSDEAEALKVKQEVERGEKTFEAMAKQHSKDSGSKANGGDLGFFPRGLMVTKFEEVAFTLEKGKVSMPVKTTFGYHLIVVEERGTIKELSDSGVDELALKALKEEILDPIVGEIYNKTIASLKGEYKVVNNLPLLEASVE